MWHKMTHVIVLICLIMLAAGVNAGNMFGVAPLEPPAHGKAEYRTTGTRYVPAGWTVIDNLGSGGEWNTNDTFSVVNRTNGTGLSMAAEAYESGIAWDTEIWCPAIDITTSTTVTLEFESNFQDYAGNGDAWVDVSTNSGTTWTNLWTWTTDHGPTFESVDLSAYVGNTIILRWRYACTSSTSWYWHLDDVHIFDNNGDRLTEDFDPASPDLSASWKHSPRRVAMTDPLHYKIVLRNSGDLDAGAATLVDPYPPGTTYLPGTLDCTYGSCYEDGSNVYWSGSVPSVPDSFILDDGAHEIVLGVNDSVDGIQWIWLNRFTPDPGDFPLEITQVSTLFGSSNVPVGGDVDMAFYQDTDSDGDPSNALLVHVHSDVIQYADQATWNVYDLPEPVIMNGPGDVLIGVINRYQPGPGGALIDHPAPLDQTVSQVRSWIGWWTDSLVPEIPELPPDSIFGTIDTLGFPGNWLIRFESKPHIAVAFDVSVSVDCPGLVENIAVIDDPALLTPMYIQAVSEAWAAIPLEETFNSGVFPSAGWSVIDTIMSGEPGSVWNINDPGGHGNLTAGDSLFASVDSGIVTGGTSVDTELWLPVMALPGSDSVNLLFDTFFQTTASTDTAEVDISLDGGTSWINLFHWTNSLSGTLGTDLSQFAGLSDVVIRFHFLDTGTNSAFWELDDIVITVCGPPPTNANLYPVYQEGTECLGFPYMASLTVTNSSTVPETYDVSVSSPWWYSAPATVGPVPPNTQETFHVWVTPETIGSETISVTVTGQGDPSATDSSDLLISGNNGGWIFEAPQSAARMDNPTLAYNGKVYTLGGYGSGDVVESFDPATGLWTTLTSTDLPDYPNSTAVVNGVAYIMSDSTSAPARTLFAYDLDLDSWSTFALPDAAPAVPDLWAPGMASLNGHLYVMGGATTPGGGNQTATYSYDPGTNTWTQLADMNQERDFFATYVYNGMIYVAGGIDSAGNVLSHTEYYNPGTDTWTSDPATFALLPEGRGTMASAQIDSRFYIMTGLNTTMNLIDTVICYDMASNQWIPEGNVLTSRYRVGGAALGDDLYVIGGSSGGFTYTDTTQRYMACEDPPTPTPTSTATPTPTQTPTSTPTFTPTPIPTSTPIPTMTPTRTPTITPSPPPTFTPTPVPFTPTPVPTSTPVPTMTPDPTHTAPPVPTYTPEPTHTAPPQPTSTPTPDSGCDTLGCDVYMPLTDFTAGDECYCEVYVCNTSDTTYTDIPVFVLLDVYGVYFFAPSFGEFDYYDQDLPSGLTTISVLPSFTWPADVGSATGINWIAAMTNPEISELHGELGQFTFGWH